MRSSLQRDVIVYGIGEIAVKGFGLITLPLYTRLFSPSEFGLLGVTLTLTSLAMAILAMGSDTAYARFFFAASDDDHRVRVSTTWIGFIAVWATLTTLVFLPWARPMNDLITGGQGPTILIALALAITPVRLTNIMLAQVLRNQFRAGAYTLLNVGGLVAVLSSVMYSLLVLNMGIEGVLVGMLVGEALQLPVRAWAARSMFAWTVSFGLLKTMVRYGAPIVPASLAYWVFSASDRILLTNLSTLEQVGLYGVAASLVSIATVAVTALGQAWTPHAMRAFEEDRSRASSLHGHMLILVIGLFGTLAVMLSSFAPQLVGIVAGAEFVGAEAAIGPLSLGLVAYASTVVTSGGIVLMGRTNYLAVLAWLAALANIGLNAALIPTFGMVGAAWSSAGTYTALTLAYLLISQRVWRAAYVGGRTTILAGLTFAFVLGTYPVDRIVSAEIVAPVKAAYAAVFVILLLGSRLVRREDFEVLRRAVQPEAPADDAV